MYCAIIVVGRKTKYPSHITVMVCIARANREAIQKVPRHETRGLGNRGTQGQRLWQVQKYPSKISAGSLPAERVITTNSMNCVHSSHPIPSEAKPPAESSVFTKRIGSTNYRVSVHFSTTSRETMNDKILRLMKNEAARP